MSKLSFDRYWNYVQRHFLTDPRFTVDGIPFFICIHGSTSNRKPASK